jgi:fermentation-respiration switch protein FrsA (DUF1100 family)
MSKVLALLRTPAVRRIAIGTGVVTVLAAVGCATIQNKERELTFRVVPGTASWYSGLPDGVQEMYLPVSVGGAVQRIHAWWWPTAPDAPAILYLHGSRWNLTGQLFRIEQLHEFGFSVLAIDYRGFGQSDGDLPSEKTVYEDARVAWQRLVELQPDPALRFVYGHSLGGAVAVDLAAELSDRASAAGEPVAARGLIVESSFTTLADIAKALTAPWLPVQLLLSQTFDSVHKIARVRVPVFIVHGAADRYVPSRFSQELYDAAPDPKKLLVVTNGTHNNSMRIGNGEYRAALQEFFSLRTLPAYSHGSGAAQASAAAQRSPAAR